MTGLSKLGLLPLLLTGSAVAFSGSGSPLRVHVRRINVNVNVNASPRLARGYEYAYIRSTSTLFQSIKGNEETDEYLIISGTSVPPQSVSAPPKVQKATASKREMMGFAIPALGIFLTNPLLSNIDNAFVGQTIGATGLAALSPATLCTDQVLYLFSFLSRATTGLVSRAYAGGDTQKAKEAASAPPHGIVTMRSCIGCPLRRTYSNYAFRHECQPFANTECGILHLLARSNCMGGSRSGLCLANYAGNA
jgi:hypothetical protein